MEAAATGPVWAGRAGSREDPPRAHGEEAPRKEKSPIEAGVGGREGDGDRGLPWLSVSEALPAGWGGGGEG